VAFSHVQVDQTGVAMGEFQKELRGLAAGKPITQLELEEAKNNVIRGLPEQLEALWPAVEQVARAWAWELPMTDFQALPERIAGMSLAEVNAAARKYARADRAFFVLVGDREKIDAQVRGLGLGQVVVE